MSNEKTVETMESLLKKATSAVSTKDMKSKGKSSTSGGVMQAIALFKRLGKVIVTDMIVISGAKLDKTKRLSPTYGGSTPGYQFIQVFDDTQPNQRAIIGYHSFCKALLLSGVETPLAMPEIQVQFQNWQLNKGASILSEVEKNLTSDDYKAFGLIPPSETEEKTNTENDSKEA